jgi:long-subunit fatty acid transport protein
MAIDTKAISLANNVTADPPGIASIHYNPAGLSLMGNGTFISMGLVGGVMKKSGKFEADSTHVGFHDFQGNNIEDPLAGKEGNISTGVTYLPLMDDTIEGPMAGPIFGISHRTPGSKWTFGYTAYPQYAGGWKYGADDPSVYGARSVYMQHLVYAAPAVSYRINNNLSIGATVGLGQTAMGVTMEMRAPNEIVNITKILGDATKDMSNPILDLTVPMPLFGGGIGVYDTIGTVEFNMRDDFSPSYILGTLWEPFDWISFGLCYQSAIKSHMSGTFSFQYSEDWQRMVAWSGSTAVMQIASIIFDLPYNVEEKQTGTVTADLAFPQIINFGINLKPTKRLSLLGELHWAEWSSIKEDNIRFDQKIQLLQLSKFMGYSEGPYNMKMTRKFNDTLNWGVGAEYQLLDWLQLRAGYENRKTSTVERYYDLLYALPSVDYFGAGLGIKWKDINIDLALGYMVSKIHKVAAGSSVNMSSYVLGAGLQSPYRGLNYEEKLTVYLGSVKLTMPLDLITDPIFDLLPAKWGGPKDKKVVELKTPRDSSITFIDNMRYENKFYFIENSE